MIQDYIDEDPAVGRSIRICGRERVGLEENLGRRRISQWFGDSYVNVTSQVGSNGLEINVQDPQQKNC